LVTSATTRFVVCKYSIAIAPFTRLNFGTRTHFFGHGTPNFCRVNAKLRVSGSKILSGPRPPQEVVSARLKMGPRTENLLRTRFVSHIAKILCLYKQNIEGNVVRRSHILYKGSNIYYMVMHKDAIQLVILLNSSQSPQQSEVKRNSVSKQFHLAMLIYVMVKIIVISY
jgi:hypothetical protein